MNGNLAPEKVPSLTDPCIHVLKYGKSLDSVMDEFQKPGNWRKRMTAYSPMMIKAFVDVSSSLHKSVERWWNWLPRDLPWLVDEKTFVWLYCMISALLLPKFLGMFQHAAAAQREWKAGTKKIGCMNFTLFYQYLVAIADNFSPSPDPDDLACFLDDMLRDLKSVVSYNESSLSAFSKEVKHSARLIGYCGISVPQGLVRNEKGWTKLPLATSKFDCTNHLSSISKDDLVRRTEQIKAQPTEVDASEFSGISEEADSVQDTVQVAFAHLAATITEIQQHANSDACEDADTFKSASKQEMQDYVVIAPPYNIKIDLKKHVAAAHGTGPTGENEMGEIMQAASSSADEAFPRQAHALLNLARPRSVVHGSLHRGSARSRAAAKVNQERPQSADLLLCTSRFDQLQNLQDHLGGHRITNLWRKQARTGHVQSLRNTDGSPAPRPCIFGSPSGLYPPLQLQPAAMKAVPGLVQAPESLLASLSTQSIPPWAVAFADRVAVISMPSTPPV